MSKLRLLLLGSPQLSRTQQTTISPGNPSIRDEQQTEDLKLSRRKAMALLAYLAVTDDKHPRETLATLLWPDCDASLAYSYLRRELAILNKTLGEGWLETDREQIRLIRQPDFYLDVARFWELLSCEATPSHPPDEVCPNCLPLLTEAVDLYRGNFMAGFSLANSDQFAEWQYFEQENLYHGLTEAFKRVVQGYIDLRRLDEAIHYAQRWLSFDPGHEAIHRQLMQLYAWAGNRGGALRQYQDCVQIIKKELDETPDDATQALFESIKANEFPPLPPTQPINLHEVGVDPETSRTSSEKESALQAPGIFQDDPTLAPPSTPHNLPPNLTPFFGREGELAQIKQMLQDEPTCRMVTLRGIGGIGKTRLAVQSARYALDIFTDGVYLISLATISSYSLLIPTIADALNLSFEGQIDLKSQLLNYLRRKTILLVFDNFEHLLADHANEIDQSGASILTDILTVAPDIKLLVTSRERLSLQEEWRLEIGGLDYPTTEEADHLLLDTDSSANRLERAESQPLEAYSAIKLFLESAVRAQPGYTPTEAEKRAIVDVCRMVRGMPLGIELASAWVGILSIEALIGEIQQNLDFLTSTVRNIPERHRSLRLLFEHSWQLLVDPARQIVSRLSIFRGSFSREAAEQVVEASLPQLRALIEKSMLRTSPGGRYAMHEIIRQYAAEKLAESPEVDREMNARHARYYATFLHRLEPELLQEEWPPLAKIAAEIDNVSAAWNWAVTHGATAEIGQSLVSLHLFYYAYGWLYEGDNAFNQAIKALSGTPAETQLVMGQLLTRRGHFTYRLGHHDLAQVLLTESLAIFDQLETTDPCLVRDEKALALYYLAAAIRVAGDYRQAGQLCQESLDLYQQNNDQRGMANALKLLGIIDGTQGNYVKAQQRFQAALEQYQRLADQKGVANTLNDLGIVADRLGQLTEAKKLHETCLALRRQIGHRWGIGISLNNLGLLAIAQGNYAQATELLQESLSIQQEIGDQYHIANCLANLGSAFSALGARDEAHGAFIEGLVYADEINATSLTLEILAGIASLLMLNELADQERAAVLFSLITAHPTSEALTKDKAEAGLVELAEKISTYVMTTARQQGYSIELKIAVAEVVGVYRNLIPQPAGLWHRV